MGKFNSKRNFKGSSGRRNRRGKERTIKKNISLLCCMYCGEPARNIKQIKEEVFYCHVCHDETKVIYRKHYDLLNAAYPQD